jgi:limonene-1,2-epoxide hydrolase
MTTYQESTHETGPVRNPDHPAYDRGINRRDIVTVAGAIAAIGMVPARSAESDDRTEVEIANETLVSNFCRDYSKLDVNVLAAYLADDIIYQISETQGIVDGLEEYIKRQSDLGERFELIDWQILRSHVIGPLVINERIDYFIARPEARQPNMRFAVAGYFLVQDGKIQVWRDFTIPGARQIVSPSPDTRKELLEELAL